MTEVPSPAGPAQEDDGDLRLPVKRPAEVSSVIAGLVALAAGFGLDLSAEQVLGMLAVIAGLPTIVTWLVGLYRDAARDLGW